MELTVILLIFFSDLHFFCELEFYPCIVKIKVKTESFKCLLIPFVLILKSQQFAASLASKGLMREDRLAIWGNNHSEWLLALHACYQLGILVVSISSLILTYQI